ncbi:MAG: hypothetical protein ABSG03_40350 [Bryobacteraceae bacterium]
MAAEKAAVSVEKNLGGVVLSKPVSMIGIEPDELRWVKILVSLLRHPNPGIPELARQALQYLVQAASQRTPSPDLPLSENEHRRP